MPEARLPIAQAIILVGESSKSNSVSMAVDAAFEAAQNAKNLPVPAHLRDTHYKGHDKIGSGEGYLYPHDFPGHYVKQQYLPDDALSDRYYFPSDQGFEDRIRLQKIEREKRNEK